MSVQPSDPRVELILRNYAAWERQDVEAAIECGHPDIVADWSRSRGPYAGIYRGRDEVTEFFIGVLEVWADLEYVHEEFIPLEERVVRIGGMRARGSDSGVEISARGAQIFEFTDGLISRVTLYQSREEALAAAGAGAGGPE